MIGRQEQSSDGLPGGSVVKNTRANAGDSKCSFNLWVGRCPGGQNGNSFRKSHGQRSLVGCSPRGHKESDTTERLSTHTHTQGDGGDRDTDAETDKQALASQRDVVGV